MRGHDADHYLYLVGSIALFVLIGNLFGVVPTVLNPPTSDKTVPLACAILVFLYFNWKGIRKHGIFGYLKLFTGGVHWGLWLLIFPVEIISTCARLLSLTVRLWANIFASDLLYELFLALFAQAALWGWEKYHGLGIALGSFACDDSDSLSRVARLCFLRAGLRLHDSAVGLSRNGHGGGTLIPRRITRDGLEFSAVSV